MIRLVSRFTAAARRPGLLLASLVVVMLAFAVAQGMVVPAIPAIAQRFGSSEAEATWVLAANLAITALSLPLVGRLGDVLGRRRVLLVTLVLLLVGGVVAALAPTLPWLIAGRALQGVGGGVYPLCFALAREHLPRQRQDRAIGLLAVSVGVGGSVGLPIGGALLDLSSYTWILWSNATAAAVAAIGVVFAVPAAGLRYPSKLDVLGSIGLAGVVVLPMVAISRFAYRGLTDPRSLALLVGSVLAFAFLLWAERRAVAPMVDVVSLRARQVVLTNLATVLVGVGNFGLMITVSQVAQAGGAGLEMSATEAGLLLLPGSLVMIPMGVLAALMAQRTGYRLVLAVGGGLAAGGFSLAAVWGDQGIALVVSGAVIFAGVGFVLAAAAALVLDMVPVSGTGAATGLNGLCRLVGSAVGAPIAVAILSLDSPGPGLLAAGSITAVFWTFSGLMVIALALAGGLPRRGGTRFVAER